MLAPASSSSWLASLPKQNRLCGGNQQIVPRVPVSRTPFSNINFKHGTPQLQRSASGQAAVAVPAVAAAAIAAPAAAVAARSPAAQASDTDDVGTTRARLYALYEFVAAHNRLPDMQEAHQGVAVGQWAEKCRQLHQQQGLEQDLAAALQTIPGWDWEPQVAVLSDGFHSGLQQLAEYSRRYGRPPQRSKRATTTSSSGGSSSSSGSSSSRTWEPSDAEREAAVALSRQLVEQRKRGVLTQQQLDAVAEAVPGWHWDVRIRSPPLEVTIASLQAFHHEHGRLPKPSERLADGFLIGEWCMTRRGEYARGQLEADVAAALESQVPGWLWNRLDSVFEKNLVALAGFVAEHGRMPAQRDTWGGVRVGAWCNKRRLQYKAGTLAADRAAALEAIPGWWWSCDQMPE